MPEKIYRIAITGPECTGKTTLSQQLAAHYDTIWIPEFAREYVENLKRPYTYEDVCVIAKKQIDDSIKEYPNAKQFIFHDTYLIITKIWFLWVYKTCPDWVYHELKKNTVDVYLLCYPDIEWKADNVRENGGETRMELFNLYKKELEFYNKKYFIVKGYEENRLNSAIQFLDSLYKI
jgi:nicotinamide riboside kinase